MKEVFILMTIASSVLYFCFISSFKLNAINIIFLSLFTLFSIYHACSESESLFAITIVGLPIVMGLVNEWSSILTAVFSGYYWLALIISCLAGYAFFKMFIHQANELFKEFQLSLLIPLIANLAFWLCLISQYNVLPWYFHLSMFITSVLASGVYGYLNKGGKIRDILKQIFTFLCMSAHFIAEGCIAAAQAIQRLRIFFAVTSIVTECVLDAPSMISDNGSHPHTTKVDDKCSHINLVLSLSYAICIGVLGYFEIPRLMRIFRITLSPALEKIVVISVVFLGALACCLVNYSTIKSGEHSHSGTANLVNQIFTLRSLLAFFGAILTSTVGVAISYEIFNLPKWLFIIMIIFAFIVEWNFLVANMPKHIRIFDNESINPNDIRKNDDKSIKHNVTRLVNASEKQVPSCK